MKASYDKTGSLEGSILGVLNTSAEPLSQRALAKRVRASGVRITETAFAKSLRAMVSARTITVAPGARNARLYWLPGVERPQASKPEAVGPLEALHGEDSAGAHPETLDFVSSKEATIDSHTHGAKCQGPQALRDAPIPGDPFSIGFTQW